MRIPRFMRHKHQKLVLRCYPRSRAAETKPLGSELSYLCYYCSTRTGKIPKVVQFIETKTLKDLYRGRQGEVVVTLAIYAALLDKCHRELNLIALNYLRTLLAVIGSNDAVLVEASLDSFRMFCKFLELSILAIDEDVRSLFMEVMGHYLSIAKTSLASSSTNITGAKAWNSRSPTIDDQLRYRRFGLDALQCVSISSAFQQSNTSWISKHVRMIVNGTMDNLWCGTGHAPSQESEKDTVEISELVQRRLDRRQSGRPRSVRSNHTSMTLLTAQDDEQNTAQNNENAQHRTDEFLRQENALSSLSTLINVFQVQSARHIAESTSAVIEYILHPGNKIGSAWAETLVVTLADSTAVQYTHQILVTCLDALPVEENNSNALSAEQLQMVLRIIRALLASDMSMIGISALDVLAHFTTQMHLQLSSPASGSLPSTREWYRWLDRQAIAQKPESDDTITSLGLLLECVGALASHTFYPDQVADSVEFLIAQPFKAISEQSRSSQDAVLARTSPLPNAEKLFLLQSVVQCISTGPGVATTPVTADVSHANGSQQTSNSALARKQVPFGVWREGFALLHDIDATVRAKFLDVLMFYLRTELGRGDLRAVKKTELEALEHSMLTSIYQFLRMTTASPTPEHKACSSDVSRLLAMLDILHGQLDISERVKTMSMLFRVQSDIFEENAANGSKNQTPEFFDQLLCNCVVQMCRRFQVADLNAHIAKSAITMHDFSWELDVDVSYRRVDASIVRSEFVDAVSFHSAFSEMADREVLLMPFTPGTPHNLSSRLGNGMLYGSTASLVSRAEGGSEHRNHRPQSSSSKRNALANGQVALSKKRSAADQHKTMLQRDASLRVEALKSVLARPSREMDLGQEASQGDERQQNQYETPLSGQELERSLSLLLDEHGVPNDSVA